MSTAVTMKHRLSFTKRSLTSNELYYIDQADTVPVSVIEDLAKEVKRQGYIDVKVSMIITFPP